MHKKIDLFFRGKYLHSTNSAKTCKYAKERTLEVYGENIKLNRAGYSSKQLDFFRLVMANPNELKAFFDHSKG